MLYIPSHVVSVAFAETVSYKKVDVVSEAELHTGRLSLFHP